MGQQFMVSVYRMVKDSGQGIVIILFYYVSNEKGSTFLLFCDLFSMRLEVSPVFHSEENAFYIAAAAIYKAQTANCFNQKLC